MNYLSEIIRYKFIYRYTLEKNSTFLRFFNSIDFIVNFGRVNENENDMTISKSE